MYENGQTKELESVVGPGEEINPYGQHSEAFAINDAGQIVGQGMEATDHAWYTSGFRPRAVIWEDEQMRGLPSLPNLPDDDDRDTPVAYAINNNGQVVGSSDLDPSLPHAVLWENGTVRDLGTLGGEMSVALGINDNGQVVGWSETSMWSEVRHAFLWDKTNGMQDLGALPSHWSVANAINDKGQIVGKSGNDAVLWENGQIKKLGDAAADDLPYREAVDINENGTILGHDAGRFGGGHTSVYDHGEWHQVSYIGTDQMGINDAGSIATTSYNEFYAFHALLLTRDFAPEIFLTAPSDGATVSGGSVTLSAEATDDVGVTNVQFEVNGRAVGHDSTSGGASGNEYSVSWDSRSVPNGPVTIAASATDGGPYSVFQCG